MIFKHIPIMPDKCIEGLSIKKDGVYIDATLGGGGHSRLIGEMLSEEGTLIGIDRDTEALGAAKAKRFEMQGYICSFQLQRNKKCFK